MFSGWWLSASSWPGIADQRAVLQQWNCILSKGKKESGYLRTALPHGASDPG